MNFIYITENLINGKQYVGSHNGSESDKYLGSGKLIKHAIKKYGINNFKRKIIEECDISQNLLLEEKYIKEYNTLSPNGYNILEKGGISVFDDELIKKLRNKKEGIKQSEKTKEKRRKSMLGKNTAPKTEEHKRNQSKSMTGKIPWNKDKFFSEEAKQNMRKPHKKFSEETKKMLSAQRKKRIKTEEHRKNISKSKMGVNNPMYGKPPWNKGLKRNLINERTKLENIR